MAKNTNTGGIAIATPKRQIDHIEDLYASHERQGALLDVIDEKFHEILSMGPGKAQIQALERTWLIFCTAREIHNHMRRDLVDAIESTIAERKGSAV